METVPVFTAKSKISPLDRSLIKSKTEVEQRWLKNSIIRKFEQNTIDKTFFLTSTFICISFQWSDQFECFCIFICRNGGLRSKQSAHRAGTASQVDFVFDN